jgi:hypothetical protein
MVCYRELIVYWIPDKLKDQCCQESMSQMNKYSKFTIDLSLIIKFPRTAHG